MTISRLINILLAIQLQVLAVHFGWMGHDGVAPSAVVLIEGFDHLIASLFTTKGWSANPSSVAAGRWDGHCITYSSGISATKTLPSNYSTIIAGFAFQWGGTITGTGNFFVFKTGATNTCQIQLDTGGHIVVKNSSGTTIATSTTALAITTWYYLEFKLVVNGASGSIECHINGVNEFGPTTGNFGSSNIDTIQLSRATVSANSFDDLYVADTSGSSPRNTFLGDSRVETVYPNADGAHTAWTATGGGTHFSQVDENTGTYPDGDTSYVSDATPGDIDSYAVGDVDGGATIFGVQINLYARKDDANTRQIAPVIRQGGTDYVGNTFTMGSSYATSSQIYNQDPTSSDWTAAHFNGDEFGVKEIA